MKMKKYLLISALILVAFASNAQNINHPIGISIGVGKQNYNGDLGNTFFKTDEEFYGVLKLGVNV